MTPKTRVKKLEDKLKPAEPPVKITVYWDDEPPPDGDDGIVLTWGDTEVEHDTESASQGAGTRKE